MTTIAYKDGVIAGDSQSTGGGNLIISLATPKCFSKDGNLLGVCGLFGDNLKIIKWFHGGMEGDVPEINEDSEAIIVTANGDLFGFWENQTMTKLGGLDFYAIGSGSPIAFGALHMGATAIQAVEAAIAHDVYSGGEISSFSLREKVIAIKKIA